MANANTPQGRFCHLPCLGMVLTFLMLPILVTSQKAVPTVSSEVPTNRQETTADVPYTVSGTGVTQQGVHYKLSSGVSTSDPKVFIDAYQASDTITITGLNAATRYYYKAFATNAAGTTLSTERNFYTLSTEPTSNCGTVSITSLSSTSISFSYSASTNFTHYAIFTVAGSTPIDPLTIVDGISTNSQTGDLFKQEATATTFTRGALTPNTTYSISVIPLKRSGFLSQTNNYLTSGTITTVTFTTYKDAPTVQASNIVGSDKTLTSATISWTNGNGDGRVAYINTINSFTAPSNGDYPTANSEYSGSGQQAVYNGTGSSVGISGLSSGTTYYLRVYEYNNPQVGFTMYNTNTATDNPKGCALPFPIPDEQDYDIVFSDVTVNSMTVSWTVGDGTGRIVVMNDQDSFTEPLDSTVYVGDNYWNNDGEQVIYNGSESSVGISNLEANTLYYFRVYAYNDEPKYAVFNTEVATNNPNSKRSLGYTPSAQHSQIVFSNVTASGLTVSWTLGDGTYSLVAMNTSDSWPDPVDGNIYTTNSEWQNSGVQRVYSGGASTVNITGLTSGNTYYFKVWAFNNDDSPLYKIGAAINNPNSIQIGGTNVWDGSVSNDWFDAGNWSLNYVPIGQNDIVIDGATNFPSLDQNATVNNLTITDDGQITIENGITLNANGNLVIQGNSGGSGSLVINGSGSVSVSGTYYFTRHTGITSDWHLASIPNSNTNISQFTGHFVNRWNETTNSWTQLNNSHALQVMKGYSIKSSTRDTVRFTGAFNNGSQSITVTNSNLSNEDYGWNMVGNPYPSAIDWDAASGWSRASVDNTIYKYDASAGQYVTFNHETGIGVPEGTSGIIPAGNGFYILSTVSSTSLGVDNDARVHSAQTFLKSEDKVDHKIVRLSISNGTSVDEAAVLFHPEARNPINKGLDAYKLFSPKFQHPQIFMLSSNHDKKMMLSSINDERLKELTGNNYIEIPFGFINNFSPFIQFSVNQNTIGNEFDIYLFNRATGEYHNLSEPFTLKEYEGEYLGLLTLRVTRKDSPLGVDNQCQPFNIEIYSVRDEICINSQEALYGTIRVFDITGRAVHFGQLSGDERYRVKNVNKSGIFVVLINDKRGQHSKHIYVE